MSTKRLSIRNEDGKVQTAALGALVGIMIVAAAVALILVGFNNDSSSSTPPNQAAAAQVTDTPSPTTGSSSAASSSAASSSAAPKAKPATSKPAAKPSTSKPASAKPASIKPAKSITYTVKRGDNLTVIAAWFHQHGYGKLYDLNKKLIGNNPNLIFPGQKITVGGKGMSVASSN